MPRNRNLKIDNPERTRHFGNFPDAKGSKLAEPRRVSQAKTGVSVRLDSDIKVMLY